MAVEIMMNKILIVDDEEAIRILYTAEFEEDGHKVIATGDGSRVMELIDRQSPDLIVLDIKLGNYNGLDLLQEIRNTRYDLPVILSTAYPAFRHDPKSIAADYYVLKTSNFEQLKLKIKMALTKEIETPSPGVHHEVQEARLISSRQMKPHWADYSCSPLR
jgi:DNA-binding response OmpR family regulator